MHTAPVIRKQDESASGPLQLIKNAKLPFRKAALYYPHMENACRKNVFIPTK